MSLDWNVGDVADFENVCFEQRDDGRYVRPVTNAIVMSTMATDMRGITEDTVDEFAWRLDLYQRMFGALIVEAHDGGFIERFITVEEVRAHVGLSTNVAPQSRAKWLKRMTDLHYRDYTYNNRVKERA